MFYLFKFKAVKLNVVFTEFGNSDEFCFPDGLNTAHNEQFNRHQTHTQTSKLPALTSLIKLQRQT